VTDSDIPPTAHNGATRHGEIDAVQAAAGESGGLSQPIATPAHERRSSQPLTEAIFQLDGVSVAYGGKTAVKDVTFDIHRGEVTALIGPSGCGKSTLLRCLNRMNDLIPAASVGGKVRYHGQDLYADDVDPVQVRKAIGMVFQKPNPFPKSIYDNIAFGPRVIGMKGNLDETVERALRRAALWDEVKDRLKENAFGMSGGQQQRLCIARCLAVEPDVILMDEPCSALDPISTHKIEDLMLELKQNYSIVIVTHNMQQAARISDRTAFFTVEMDAADEGERHGRVVEYDVTENIFQAPADPRTEAYVTGRVG
jgi:phosphate transport system ATP-binding protein